MISEENKTVEALFEVCTPELYRENPFRIAWIRSNASSRQIARHADKIKMMAELGGKGAAPEQSIFSLDPPPASDKIRDAIQALKDPQKRIIHEFFWYWPESLEEGTADEAIVAAESGNEEVARNHWRSREEKDGMRGAVGAHNMAVLYHMLALDWTAADLARDTIDLDFVQRVQHCWERAFARWEHLLHNDDLWDRVRDRIGELDDPAVRLVAARHIREKLPEALDKINAEVALLYATKNRLKMAEWHIEFMKKTHQGFDDVDSTITDVLRPARKRMDGLLKAANEKCLENLTGTLRHLSDLLSRTDPLLQLFDLFHAEDNPERNELFDEVALCCNQNLVSYYNKTQDADGSLELLGRAMSYATSLDVRETLGEGVAAIEGNREFEKIKGLLGRLRVIQESTANPAAKLDKMRKTFLPAFQSALTKSNLGASEMGQLKDSVAIVLREISISANNDHQDSATANSAITLASKYATSAALRSRLQGDQAALSQNQMMLALVKQQRAAQSAQSSGCAVIALIGLIGVIFFGSIGGCNSSIASIRSGSAPGSSILSTDSAEKPTPSPISSLSIEEDTWTFSSHNRNGDELVDSQEIAGHLTTNRMRPMSF